MNYYPFHLGDYAAHTAHLTWEEDLAYRRLLDLYYLHEKPVPADVQKLARLVRMPKQMPAIEAVLAEFFELRDDGWHNKRADDELARMSEKAEATEERDKHEKTRMQRYRERRATMFEALRGVGVIPPFDIGQKELQRLFDTHCNGHETSPGRNGDVSGDAPATAIPTPTPTPTPIPKKKPPLPPKGGDGRFEEFWLAWPKHDRKQDKKTCSERWVKEGLDEVADQILADVRAKRGTQKWREGFIEAPLVYLNRRRWEDGNTDVEPAGQETFV